MKRTSAQRAKKAFVKKNRAVEVSTGAREGGLANHALTLSNAIVRGMYSLTLNEQRLLRVAMAKAVAEHKPRTFVEKCDKVKRSTRLSAAEFAEVFEVSLDRAYYTLKHLSKTLQAKKIRWLRPLKSNQGKVELYPTDSHWLTDVSYGDAEGWVELGWNLNIFDEIVFRLEHQFTRYRLDAVHSFKSAYTYRLFEILMSYRDKKAGRIEGWLDLSIEQWCQLNALPLKDKNGRPVNSAVVERNTLKVPLADLKKAGWTITFGKKTAGRRVTGWTFAYYHDGQDEFQFPLSDLPQK
jgi:plasmid replication initiation protein